MKILITGVLGVIGEKLEKELLKKGNNVFGIDLFHTNRAYGHYLGKILNDNYYRCDISNYRNLRNIMEYCKPDLVYNCAAEFGRWNGEEYYDDVWKSNVIGTKNIIRLQEEMEFKLVHFSSSEVYGDYESVMHESTIDKVAISQMNDYAISKRVNEIQIKNSFKLYGTKSVIVRLFNTYGPGDWYHPFRSVNCVFTYKLLNNLPVRVFKGHTRTSTYIDDSINALVQIPRNYKNQEIYNIASSTNHTIENLVELVLKHTGANKDLVEYVDDYEVLTTKHKLVSNDKAVHDLNFFESVNLEEGVRNSVNWMKKYYNI